MINKITINFSRLKGFALIGTCLLLSACGFHLRGSYLLPDDLRQLSVSSFDDFGQITRLVKAELIENGATIVESNAQTPNVYIMSESDSTRTLSLYQNARAADYELSYRVRYRVSIPNEHDEIFNINITRNFLNNPMAALAKSVERDLIIDEMRAQAAEQIVRKMATLGSSANSASEANDSVTLATE